MKVYFEPRFFEKRTIEEKAVKKYFDSAKNKQILNSKNAKL